MRVFLSVFAGGNAIATTRGRQPIFARDLAEMGEKLIDLGVAPSRKDCFVWEQKYFQSPMEHHDQEGHHLFTDRGSDVTFGRDVVSDQEIRRALVHGLQKYGSPLRLFGDDPIFTSRMVKLAEELGIATTIQPNSN